MRLPLDTCTLAILAGGAGSRMGRPKGWLEAGGRPMLAHLLDQFDWPGPTLLVTAPGRERPPDWELFSREVVDAVEGEGPLRGIVTALEASATPLVVVATVDMPEVRREQLEWLVGQLNQRADIPGILLRRAEEEGCIEPFPCIFRTTAATVLRARLQAGKRSVHSLAQEHLVATLPAPQEWATQVWTNLNRPEDLRAWEGRGEV